MDFRFRGGMTAYSQVKGCGLVITRGGPQIVTSSIVQQLEGGENEAVTICNKDKKSHLKHFYVYRIGLTICTAILCP